MELMAPPAAIISWFQNDFNEEIVDDVLKGVIVLYGRKNQSIVTEVWKFLQPLL